MHKHEHNVTCHHIVKWCSHCDVTYCTLCPKEWSAKRTPRYWDRSIRLTNDLFASANHEHSGGF